MKINRKILIAEDELLIAKVLKMQFEKLGFQVENVTDGNDVLSVAERMKPDVIILDVFLKNHTSGLEAGQRIRGAGISTPIIFTTGNSYDNTFKLVENISSSVVLSKPVDFKHLLDIVNGF